MKYFLAFLLATVSMTPAYADQDVTAVYVAKDFSQLLLPKSEFLGFIGSDYQRLFIRYFSIAQDKKNPALYRVEGSAEAAGTRCGLAGTIKAGKIVKLAQMHWGVDDEYKDKGLKAEGAFKAQYELRENCPGGHAGIFSGEMQLDWYIDHEGRLLYDNIEDYSDGYSNNQYKGTWTPYGSEEHKTANWGEYRMPNSGDLDSGAARFSPREKYCSHGWSGYEGCRPGDR
jgi:hypothetical protein